jgi:hypothetical protein
MVVMAGTATELKTFFNLVKKNVVGVPIPANEWRQQLSGRSISS